MRVKEVVYSRLFNIGDYSNERIGFKVEVEEGESPEEVVTKLAEKVIILEQNLALYRELQGQVGNLKRKVDYRSEDLEELYKRLAELEIERAKIDEAKDEKERCRIISIEEEIKDVLDRIENKKEELRAVVKSYNEVLEKFNELEKKILSGQIEKIESYNFIDAEKIIKQVEKRVAKLKEERNLDADWDLSDLL